MKKKILVIGDVILDQYTHGTALGLSAETPTIVLNEERVESFIGGAGLVVRNLLRLGADVTFLTCAPLYGPPLKEMVDVRTDRPTEAEMDRLTCVEHRVAGWKYTEKRRFFSGQYKLFQVDVRNEARLADDTTFPEQAIQLARKHQLVIISDYRHGTLSEAAAGSIVGQSRGYGIPVFVDSQVSQEHSNHHWYAGCTRLFINQRERYELVKRYGAESWDGGNKELLKRYRNVVIKMGGTGSLSLEEGGEQHTYPAYKVKAIDTCGAGDAFLAAFSVFQDLAFANYWAALSTTYKGTIVPGREHIKVVDDVPTFPRYGEHL